MQLSNGLITAKFNARTGFLASIQTADASMTVDMSFVYYGARPHKYYFDFGGDHRSGAYLFLPDGDARPLPTDKNTFVVISGPVRQTIIVKGPDEIKMLQHVSLDINTAHLNIRNLVDIRSQGNFEAAMRLKTGIVENDRFYTELNGYQLIRRKHFAKLPLQAHFFPMPGAAFIEDSAHRLTLLGRQALGVASLRPGWMEVILDRRLDQHDWRGMSEPVHDNLQTESNFRLVLETVDGPPPDAEPTTAYHSLANSILAAQIHYPPIVMIANRLDSATSAKVPSEVAGLAKPLPCDVHAVALRTLSQPTKYASDGQRRTKPDNSTALVLHRYGVECRIQTKLSVSCLQMSSSNTIDIRSYFTAPVLSVHPASLSLLYTNNHNDLTQLEILPMELKTVKIKF
uniref:Glyco_hydro_38C domain-containing protein n=1 Tax=Panagrellus redivivus TaxID=6233 RepID=A0A7E4UUM6_PANRE